MRFSSWSSGQRLRLLIMRSRVRFPALLWDFSLKGRIPAVSLCRLKCFGMHKDTTPPQPNHTVTPTHIEPVQYNP